MATTQEQTASTDGGSGDGRVSRMALIFSVIVAVIVAGVGGVVIGWKVEQNRVKSDIENIRPVGTVTSVDGTSLTVALKTSGGTRNFVITPDTKVDRAEEGEAADVEEGSIVLVKNFTNDDGDRVASEIVVLPKSTNLDTR